MSKNRIWVILHPDGVAWRRSEDGSLIYTYTQKEAIKLLSGYPGSIKKVEF